MSSLAPAPIEGVPLGYRVAASVVIGWKDHGRFGSRAEALSAFREAADVPSEEAERMLNEVAASHECAVEAVPRHVRRRWFKPHPFATAKDIDQAGCLSDMTAAVPGLPDAVRTYLLRWVIH